MNDQISRHFEDQIRAALATPAATTDFVEDLAKRLQQPGTISTRKPKWIFSPVRAISLALLLLGITSILIIGPQRVLAQVLDWLGYVPGVGFVDQEGGLRVLEAPVSQTRDGITVTIEDGLIDARWTWLTFDFEGIRQELKPFSENDAGCGETPKLLLPDGKMYPILEGYGNGGETWMHIRFGYGSLPAEMNEIAVIVPCVPDVRSEAGPVNWEFTIHFVPAPQDFQVLPVATPASGELASSEKNGVQLNVNEFVELEDGYLFSGSLSWDPSLYFSIQEAFQLQAQDANGDLIMIKGINDEGPHTWAAHTVPWTVRTDRKDFAGPVRFFVPQLAVQDPDMDTTNPVFNLTFNGNEEQTWSINKIISVQGHLIDIVNAAFGPSADGQYNLNLNFRVSPDEVAEIFFRDLDNESRMISGGGGGEPGGETFTQDLQYDYVPRGEHHFVIDAFYYLLQGPWEVQVNIPAYAGVTSTSVPQTCITQESWQAIHSDQQLPLSLPGRVLLEDRSVPALLPNLILVPLDGTDPIAIGQGSWAAISPDGSKVAYAYEGLRVLDIPSGQTSLLISEDSSYAMAWSPDSQRIAFIRGGDGVHTINADGSGLQRAPGASADMIGIAGWLPDGKRIVVSRISAGGTLMQILDLGSGETEDLFLIDSLKGGFTHLSPDGTRIVYGAGVFGEMNPGIYLADLDGSNQRLLAQAGDDFMFTSGAWSPDSKQLILNPYDVGAYLPEPQHPILIDLESCQISILNRILGEVSAWIPYGHYSR